MAKFEQQARLQSIANPNTQLARGTLAVADVMQNFGQWGMERYKQQRIESATEEALAVEPSAEAPELRSKMTLTGEAYNKVVLAGHGAAIKNDYTRHINEMALTHKDDPMAFENASNAYKAELLNQVALEVRPFVDTDYDMAAINKLGQIRANFEAKVLEDNLVQMGEAMTIIGDDAARAAREGDLVALEHNTAGFMRIVDALEENGQTELATKMRLSFADRMDEQLVFGRFENSKDQLKFIENFMANPPSDLSPEKADQMAGQMISRYTRDKNLRDSATATSKKAFSNKAKDYIAALKAGVEVTPEMHNQFDPEVVNALYDADEAALINAEIADFRTFNEDYQTLALASPEEVRQLLELSKPDSAADFSREQDQYEVLLRAADARAKALAEDPIGFITAHDETFKELEQTLPGAIQAGDTSVISEYVARARSMQERMGISSRNVSLLSETMATAIGKTLDDFSQGGEAAVASINALRDGFGAEWPAVNRQLAQEKKIGTTAQTIATIDNPNSQVFFAEALTMRKEYEELAGDDNKKDVLDMSVEIAEPLTNTLRIGYGDAGVKQANSLRAAMEAGALKLLVEGKESSPDDALSTAFEMLVGDVEFYDTFRVPIDQHPAAVYEGMLEKQRMIKEGELDIFAPPSATLANTEDAKAVFRKALNIVPINSVDGAGIIFIDQHGSAIRDPEGKVIEFTFDELKTIGEHEIGTVY